MGPDALDRDILTNGVTLNVRLVLLITLEQSSSTYDHHYRESGDDPHFCVWNYWYLTWHQALIPLPAATARCPGGLVGVELFPTRSLRPDETCSHIGVTYVNGRSP